MSDGGQAAPSSEPNGAGPAPNGASSSVDALYRSFLDRAAALPERSVGAAEMLLDKIVNSSLPFWMFKPLAAAIAKATGLDREDLTKQLRRQREAQTRLSEVGAEGAGAPTDPAAAYAQCHEIAEDPALLSRLLDVASRLGIAGDRRGVISTFLVAISRLLPDPVRMLRKGSPASGKNYVIDNLLPLFNRSIDYVLFTAASAKSLFYSTINFQHKLFVIPEAAALAPTKAGNNEEFAMILRELISSGRLLYHTVQPTGPNGSLVGTALEKEGPVALIMTTARDNVEEEMATRMLVTITDEGDSQTRLILSAAADKAAGGGPPPLTDAEFAQWRAYQDWLRLGPCNVVIPFAPVIAGLTDRRTMRIRRDLPAMLSLVKASALMHRAQRESDAQGRIVAKPDDYALAVASLGEGLEELAHGGDTSAIEAVRLAVCRALAERHLAWRQMRALVEFWRVLHKHLIAHGHTDVAARVIQACLVHPNPPGLKHPQACIAFVSAIDPTIHISDKDKISMYRAVAKVLKGLRSTNQPPRFLDRRFIDDSPPEHVELSTNKLGVLLGIGRGGARARLNNAIESGAVIDVGAGDPARNRTAPKLLTPGRPVSPQQTSRRPRTGAFPSLPEVMAAIGRNLGGV